MGKKLLTQKERWYADSHKEAEEIVTDAKQDEALTMQKIHEKHNSKGFYYLVDLERTYSTAKEEMERPKNNGAPDGQMSIDEGVEYTVEKDGSITVPNDELSDEEIDAVEFVEDQEESKKVNSDIDGSELPF
ncbi:MAG: organic solvent tolerance protein OstA [Psychrobacillus psychrodurans]